MRFCLKLAIGSGLIGLTVMAGIVLTGPPSLWELAFWPSRMVGMGFDELYWPGEIGFQFGLYALAGLFIGLVCTFAKGSPWTSPRSNPRS